PPAILSRRGYFLYNDTPSAVLDDGWIRPREAHPDYRDYYLFLYGKDFARALADYRLLFGTTPLPPRYMLGLWYSRFPTLKALDIEQAVADFETHELPLDVFVLDLEWHKRGWHGFDWDTDEYGEPGVFLKGLHDRGIRVTANLHPDKIPVDDTRYNDFCIAAGLRPGLADVTLEKRDKVEKLSRFSLADRKVADAWMNVFHKPIQDEGLDFWWQDGGAYDHYHDTFNQLWTNHVYWAHMDRHYPDRRPMVFSRSSGLGSHRYPIHFTGDTYTQWEVLAHEVEYTLRAGHMGLSFVSHDISGFSNQRIPPPDDLYARWVQYGCLSPIFRLHSSFGEERRPWNFTPAVLNSFKQAIGLRMALLPYLYTLARQSHDTCMPMCRSNPLVSPDWEAGYDIWDSYFLGDRIYVTPICTPGDSRQAVLPPGTWFNGITGEMHVSDGLTGLTVDAPLEAPPPHFVKAGSLLVTQPYALRARTIPDTLVCTWYPSSDTGEDTYELYDDDGYTRAFEDDAYSRTRFITRQAHPGTVIITVTPGPHVEGLPPRRAVRVAVHNHSISAVTVAGQNIACRGAGTWDVPLAWGRETEIVVEYA
ncbi:MAG: DUF5110 domain-containing protein, partial [Chitinivibrionales bacterium]|nr:DUF5110 domain-containing protein [Chitinivibrionales bacterium]